MHPAGNSASAAVAPAADNRDLDDPFSAWDEDDAGAREPAPAPLAQASTSAPADPAIKLVDPVSMDDIEISRTSTIDDPLTTGLLAEISRSDLMSDHLPRVRPGLPTAAVVRRTRDMSPDQLSDLMIVDEELSRAALHPADGAPELDRDIHRRATRRSVTHPKDEPFRKK